MTAKQNQPIPIDDEEQSKRFIETATALTDSADDSLFQKALVKVSTSIPSTTEKPIAQNRKKSDPKTGA